MASAHHAVSGELSMRDERRPGLDGPGRMVKSRGLDGKISYLTKIWGFAKGLFYKNLDNFNIGIPIGFERTPAGLMRGPWCPAVAVVAKGALAPPPFSPRHPVRMVGLPPFCHLPPLRMEGFEMRKNGLSTPFRRTKESKKGQN